MTSFQRVHNALPHAQVGCDHLTAQHTCSSVATEIMFMRWSGPTSLPRILQQRRHKVRPLLLQVQASG